MRLYGAILLLVLGVGAASTVAFSGPADDAPKPLLGFSAAAAAEEFALETRFDAALNRDDLREWMKRISARPHHVGSPYDKDNADFIAGLLRSFGFDTQIEEFRVLFPTPKTRVLEMTAPTPFTASLVEPPIAADSTSGQSSEQLPTFNAYSIDGDVTGDLVYVNHGIPKDYEELERRGIDVRGKIVIARYGGSWRGIKPKVAAEKGAIGCIIYSDPREDGYFEGDVYPKGGFRNERSAQRGSVADMPLYSGDPLTPFIGATADAKRLDRKDAKTLTKIPVLPIHAADALPLLQALGGDMSPESWRGALPIPYHLGPGPTKVHLKLEFDWKLAPIYDVIAKVPGSERPDEWIVRGNHHDAWVNGATDPVSGLVALLAEARALGGLAKSGWKPKRTIVYCAWDGEEPGLLGSTEWVETHADLLRDKAAVYVNSDSNSRGTFEVGGSHTLQTFVNQVARDVIDPEKNISVLDRARAQAALEAKAEERKEVRERPDLRIHALGSGSDYTPFLQHLGISALNIGFGGEEEYGQYHSIYDSFDHYTRFGDPSFDYGITLAKTGGRMILRMANADVLPFEFTRFTEEIGRYVKDVIKLADDQRSETEEKNRRIEDGTFTATFDPKKTFVVPKPEAPVPYLNFAPLQNAIVALDTSTKAYEKAIGERIASGQALAPAAQAALDRVFMKCERSLTRSEGLPRRPWYVHQIYAPGFYTGYGVKTLPGVREAIEEKHWKEAEEQIEFEAQTLAAFIAEVERATAIVKGAPNH